MSRTDKTRPWWVRIADAPGTTCVAVHDHSRDECTLPDEVTPEGASLNWYELRGCYWTATNAYMNGGAVTGGFEWTFICREDRRRDRHEARRALRAYDGED